MNTGSGIAFNADGPMMTGTWFNPSTGHKFTVRDSFFQDGQFMVTTTDGQTLDYNTIQNYIQTTNEQGVPKEPDKSLLKPNVQPTNEMLPPEVASILDNNDAAIGPNIDYPANIFDNVDVENFTIKANPTPPAVEVNEDMAMTTRVLRRHPAPLFNVKIDWNCPTKQLETLVDILGIDPETISLYYTSLLDRDYLFEQAKQSLIDYINNLLAPSVPLETLSEAVPTKTKSKKKTK
jgi:hypothetical protein